MAAVHKNKFSLSKSWRDELWNKTPWQGKNGILLPYTRADKTCRGKIALSWNYFKNVYKTMDQLPNEQNFDLDKSRRKFHHSLKEHHKISNIQSFVAKCCKMRII
jgi:hypothetical protein